MEGGRECGHSFPRPVEAEIRWMGGERRVGTMLGSPNHSGSCQEVRSLPWGQGIVRVLGGPFPRKPFKSQAGEELRRKSQTIPQFTGNRIEAVGRAGAGGKITLLFWQLRLYKGLVRKKGALEGVTALNSVPALKSQTIMFPIPSAQ